MPAGNGLLLCSNRDGQASASMSRLGQCINTATTTTTTILQPLYRKTCINRHLQLRTGGFCWSKVLLPACPCWWQLVHS